MNLRILQDDFYIKDWNTFETVEDLTLFRQAQGTSLHY